MEKDDERGHEGPRSTPEVPVVAHLICNAVLVCSCPARIVLVLSVVGGFVKCPACHKRWWSPSMKIVAETGIIPARISAECQIAEVPEVLLAGEAELNNAIKGVLH